MGEVKGRLLTESQVADVVEVCRKLGGIFDVVLIDMGMHRKADIEFHRSGQAEAITEHLTPEHHPQFVASVWNLRRRL
jgi:hypothetical protein